MKKNYQNKLERFSIFLLFKELLAVNSHSKIKLKIGFDYYKKFSNKKILNQLFRLSISMSRNSRSGKAEMARTSNERKAGKNQKTNKYGKNKANKQSKENFENQLHILNTTLIDM